jgi:lathosterol oxidase
VKRARRISEATIGRVANGVVPVVLVGLGLLHPTDPALWFSSLAIGAVALIVPVLALAAVWWWATSFVPADARIQGPRRRPAPIAREAFESGRAMFVVATMMAWPMTQYRLGHPTGLRWSLEEAGGLWFVLLTNLVIGVIAIDAWTYLKHRLLHTRLLFAFHRDHHAYRDPTPFAGFAVSPVETVLTFWPLLILMIPAANHWAPLYFGLVIGFVSLNFYLHSGVLLAPLEATLPRLFLNTSAFHNVHHAKVNRNFGEVSFLWDWLLGTADTTNPHHVTGQRSRPLAG